MEKARNQPSKKGRRAWRKNIDLGDIEKGLEERREEAIEQGKPIDEMEASELFYVDEDEDEQVLKRMAKQNIKPLKSTEILYARSKVPALESRNNKRKMVEGMTGKQIHKLMKLAGKVQGVDRTTAQVEQKGVDKASSYDLWGAPESSTKKSKKSKKGGKKDREVPEVLEVRSSTSITAPKHVPDTIRRAPVQLAKIEKLPHAGRSYNPDYTSWRQLIELEYFKEKPLEDRRLALEQEQERIQYMIDNYDDNEMAALEDDDDDDDEDDDDQNEGDGDRFKLSINAPTRNKRKSAAKRRKAQAEKDKEQLRKEIKALRKTIAEIETLPELLEKQKAAAAKKDKRDYALEARRKEERRIAKGTSKLGSKYEVRRAPLEVKLSDELKDSLRKLKPEGSLLVDTMRDLEASGKVVSRRRVEQKKAKKKITGKWSYKDFK